VLENERIIRNAEKKVKDFIETNVRIKHCAIIIEKAKKLLKYENKGIPLFTPPPSELIKEYTEKHDKIIIDTMPDKIEKVLDIAELLLNALMASHEIYIPFQPKYLALKGIGKLLDAVEFIREEGNKNLVITAIIGTRLNSKLVHHRESIEKIQESFGDNLLYANIRENIALAEASSFGQPIFKYRLKSNGAKDYTTLCREILKKDRRS